MSRNGALKVLNHALSGEEGRENCAKFVDILGLRTIFPLFMKTPKKHKRKGMSAEEYEGIFTKNCIYCQIQVLSGTFILFYF